MQYRGSELGEGDLPVVGDNSGAIAGDNGCRFYLDHSLPTLQILP